MWCCEIIIHKSGTIMKREGVEIFQGNKSLKGFNSEIKKYIDGG